MTETIHTDLAVIGAGSGGLSVAAGAAQMGARVVLVEKAEMGGDCLNFGCVPSKALLAAGLAAQQVRESGRFGVNGHEPQIDFAKVNDHVRDVIAGIAPHDSVERFEGLGVRVIREAARFVSPTVLEAGPFRVAARRHVIATGSSAVIPNIPGIQDVPFLTNESIFRLRDRPAHLIILGGGPIGVEMAQAHRRLGSEVTVLESREVLSREDPDAAGVVRNRLRSEGVDLREGVRIAAIDRHRNRIAVTFADGQPEVTGTQLLVAAGRTPNVRGLGLEAANVTYSSHGIDVDRRLRTSNKRIFAIGDVIGGLQFTHVAGHHAGVVIRNALFRLPAKVDDRAVPRVTYCDPEVAQVGMTAAEAEDHFGRAARVHEFPFAENDRARTERATEGFIKAVVGRRGRVAGATIVGQHAGELILPWALAIDQGLGVSAMARVIAPYPTRGEVSKRVAGSHYTDALFGPRTRRVVRFLQRLG